MNTSTCVKEINEILTKLGPVWLYMGEYTITHSRLRIALTHENGNSLFDLYLLDCISIHGPPQGGPWSMSVREDFVDDQKEISLCSENNEFVVKACAIYLEPSPLGSRFGVRPSDLLKLQP